MWQASYMVIQKGWVVISDHHHVGPTEVQFMTATKKKKSCMKSHIQSCVGEQFLDGCAGND